MPFNPQQAASTQSQRRGDAKFFDRHLTGTGGTTGLLQSTLDPKFDKYHGHDTQATARRFEFDEKSTRVNDRVTTIKIPISVLSSRALDAADAVTLPHPELMKQFGPHDYIGFWPEAVIYTETRTDPGTPNVREVETLWTVARACLDAAPSAREVSVRRRSSYISPVGEWVCFSTTTHPKASLVGSAVPESVLDDVSLGGLIADESLVWQSKVGDIVCDYAGRLPARSESADILHDVICRLASYDVPISDYTRIYSALSVKFRPETLQGVIKDNLSMMLAQTLSQLSQASPRLQQMPQLSPMPAVDPRLTQEQADAVRARGPLVLVNAAAGTGKSSVIKHRLAYMKAAGIDMRTVTCLSFTNAAADHLVELAPDVTSMTIAKMIHSIYQLNYPKHQLATAKTIANSIRIWFPYDDVALELARRVTRVSNDPCASNWTRLNNFVQNEFDHVVQVLDGVQMTTLELEVVICYQRIDTMREPSDISSRYLVLDEVQDNSLFEFVYVLKYVTKHLESLYIVGDASQTLYEFRNSNPEVLNALARTGVFENHNLQVNFRSNQAILDYANTLLADIHANETAGLHLSSNDLSAVTKQEFADNVVLRYTQSQSQRAWRTDSLDDALSSKVASDFLSDAYASGRQVALIARTRSLAQILETHVKRAFPNASVVNICPVRQRDFDTFSTFCATRWDEIRFSQVPLSDVRTCMLNDLKFLVNDYQNAYPKVKDDLDQWFAQTLGYYRVWQQAEAVGNLTHAQVLDLIKASLISYENHKNAMAQRMVGQRNEELKLEQNVESANFIVSTIHSVKGLEFDDVVIDYYDENGMSEADKRMYYVALTRAKQHELILAHGFLKTPPCELRWQECYDSYKA